jgi:spermidine synthase
MKRFPVILAISALTGALSLSQEIVWVHLLGFMTAGRPEAFAFMLGCFLLGIAGGSILGMRACRKQWNRSRFVCAMLSVSALVFLLSVLAVSLVAGNPWTAQSVLYGGVILTAFCGGGVFPVLCELGDEARGGGGGISVAWVYVANIVGAMLGSLGTGFWLMDVLGIGDIILVLAAFGILVGAVAGLVYSEGSATGFRIDMVALLVIGGVAIAAGRPLVHTDFLENLQLEHPPSRPFKHVVENRSGIVTVARDDEEGDIIYGGGIYDGRYAVEPYAGNGIHRAYMIACMHRNPAKVLEIGMSSGSWAWVLARHESVQTMDIVEINPGYTDLLREYPEHSTLLDDPKVTIHIDDGRRWLNRNADTFDFILMNTTYHWRSHATNLLSKEFLTLCKAPLKPGGIVYWNTTHNEDILRTAAEVFPHVTHWSNFVAASDVPFDMTPEERRANLLRFLRDGKPIYLENERTKKELEFLVEGELPEMAEVLKAREDLRVITDDNMVTEFKNDPKRWIDRDRSWGTLFRRLRGDAPSPTEN